MLSYAKFIKFLLISIVATPLALAAGAKHDVTLNGQKIIVAIADSHNPPLVDVALYKEKEKIGEWKSRSVDRERDKPVSVIKLSANEDREYLLFVEEPEMYAIRSWIVGLNTQGKAEQIYTGPARGKLEDFDHDGLFDFLKSGGAGEPTGPDRGSYDPYLVYRQKREGKIIRFEIDEALSKKYSQSAGFEWHGPKYNEKIQVHPKTGKTVKYP
jgi:hypothetical protein